MQKGGSNPLTVSRFLPTEFHLNTAFLVQQATSDDGARMEETPSSLAVRLWVRRRLLDPRAGAHRDRTEHRLPLCNLLAFAVY